MHHPLEIDQQVRQKQLRYRHQAYRMRRLVRNTR